MLDSTNIDAVSVCLGCAENTGVYSDVTQTVRQEMSEAACLYVGYR